MNSLSVGPYSQLNPARINQGHTVRLEETHWGYVLRSSERPPIVVVAGQMLAWGLGAICLMDALGLWLVPGSAIGGDALELKLGLTAVLPSATATLLSYASRGIDPEWQIGTTRGELREVLRNKAGRPTVLAHYGFDAIGGVVMDRATLRGRLPNGHACLVLRLGNSSRLLPLIVGPETLLAPLRDRLGRDLIVTPSALLGQRSAELRWSRAQSA